MNEAEILTQFGTYLLAERCVSRNTHLAYSKDIKQFCTYLGSRKVTLSQAEGDDIRRYLKHLHRKKLRVSSVARKLSGIKLLFSYLSERHGRQDWAKEISLPKLEKRLPRYLSEQEIEAILIAVAKDSSRHRLRNQLIIYLLYVSGMRVSELAQLSCSDVRIKESLISVTGKGGRQRLLPIPRFVMQMIEDYIEQTPMVVNEKNRKKYLFPVMYGGVIKPISRQSLWGVVKEVCVHTGIDRAISPHQLRHSLATHMLKNGVNLRSLQLLLGHENLSTVQIYTHIDVGYLREIYDKKHPRA